MCLILYPRKVDRDDIGLFGLHETDVTDEGFIEDLVDGFAVVQPALGSTFDPVSFGF
jgi:hypothetical protein